jgi:hypothetical protein
MEPLKILDAGELNNGINAPQIPCDLETELKLELEKSQKFMARFQRLKGLLSENDNPEDQKRIFNMMQKLFDLQICKEDLYSLSDFGKKYQQYISDVLEKYQNYSSDLITDENLIYALGLYRKYARDAFEEFSGEFRKCGKHSHIKKYLLPYSKFERCLYYHSYCLFVNQGVEAPNHADVNKMISTKPYGDSSLYPQYEIWQIVGYTEDSDNNAYRDYYCGLTIRQRELTKKQSEDIASESQVQENNFISNSLINREATDKNLNSIIKQNI